MEPKKSKVVRKTFKTASVWAAEGRLVLPRTQHPELSIMHELADSDLAAVAVELAKDEAPASLLSTLGGAQ